MKKIHSFYFCFATFCCAIIFCSFVRYADRRKEISLPYKQAGLTTSQAAAHLLSRFTYGAKAGDVSKLVEIGLEKWMEQQLDGHIEDEVLNGMLRDGKIHKDSVNNGKGYKDKVLAYMQQKGYKPQAELYRQFISQKILRATYTNNQLRELMTDFWFNHFNVSLSKNQCAAYVPAFERDVIRPNVLGKFENLLIATAKSPAMLMYLDNFSSAGNNVPVENTTMEMGNQIDNRNKKGKFAKAQQAKKGKQGLNENYAREVMELHTLGVDGGYSQSDVTQAARVLTGWTLAPMGENGYGAAIKKTLERIGAENLRRNGYVRDGDFLFAVNRHDNGEKTVLGKKFQAGGGYEEGVALLSMLAHHQSTAKFISKKLAIRFVNDHPPQSLIDKMAATFLSTNGDIKSVMITMVSAPEFWSSDALREKTKSPFELAISAVRSLNATVTQPYQLYTWINKMGQQMYYYQAPTGFPDRSEYWINTGSLLNRMNFGLALASKRIPGISFNLAAMNNNHEPESSEAALLTYSKIIMPERNLNATIERLKPLLNRQDLGQSVAKAAEKTAPPQAMNTMVNEDANLMDAGTERQKLKGKKALINATTVQKNGTNNMLSQVVGIIIGSPEFQRK
jgi:uncharacterized protein (DUF1800 family)